MPRLELLGAEVAERGVDPHPVAGALDAVEHLQCRLIPRLERAGARSASTGPMSDPVAASSHGLAVEPVDGSIPASRIVLPIRSETCWLPWPLWWMQPPGGLRLTIAIPSAPSASSAAMLADIDQPTILLDHTSITTAGQGHPWCARTQVMPANRALFGPSAPKSRRTRSGAESACGAACPAPPLGRLARPRVVPARPFSRTMRAARLRDVRPPRRRSSAKTFGAP